MEMEEMWEAGEERSEGRKGARRDEVAEWEKERARGSEGWR